MKKYKASAFTFRKKVNGSKVIGNPASIFILNENENFQKEQMSKISQEEKFPISCFVKNIDGNDYRIFYYNIDGSQAYMCGHGTIATAAVLNKVFEKNKEFDKMGHFNFYFDTTLFGERIRDNHISACFDGDGRIFIKQKIHNYTQIFNRDENIEAIMNSINLKDKDINDIFKATELDDIVFVINDNYLLRDLKPNFKDMAKILEKMKVRNFCVTAISDLDDFNFESRVFVPHDRLDEDIACGSSNLTISKYWKNEMNRSNFKILFPYHMNYNDKLIGGVQFTSIDDDFIKIGGFCEVLSGDLYGI